MLLIKSGLFLAGTAFLVYISRGSLKQPRSHGFYRFFAWEAILILALFRIEVWFNQILAWYQIISWCLLIIASYLVLHGLWLLRQFGRRDPGSRQEAALFEFEKTSRLVMIGAYRYIRHPLYSSLLFLAWGIFFKYPDWIGGAAAVIASMCLFATAIQEESENCQFFGEEYQVYKQKTKMFIPFLF